MFDNIDAFINIMVKYKINANQFLLCYLLFTDQKVNGRYISAGNAIANLYKYALSTKWTLEETTDLVEKGLLVNKNSIDMETGQRKNFPDMMEVTPLFISEVFAGWDRFDQLCDLYPNILSLSNGQKFKTKACDLDALQKVYDSKVKTLGLHNKIMEITQWGLDNRQLDTNFANYITGKGWETLQELRLHYNVGNTNMYIPKDE